MDGHANGHILIHNRTIDRLANPPGGIGGKTKTAFRIELFHSANQPQVPFLYQIHQW